MKKRNAVHLKANEEVSIYARHDGKFPGKIVAMVRYLEDGNVTVSTIQNLEH